MTRCGVVSLVGAPNAGKSTLLNRMVGSKVSIVTHKAQTTRSRVRGIVLHGDSQIVFVDTPGLFRTARRRLERAMLDAAWRAVDDSDLVVLLYDVQRPQVGEADAELLAALAGRRKPLVLALNKVDAVRKDRLLPLAQDLGGRAPFEAVFMLSAETGSGVDDLVAWIAPRLPEGPWLFSEDDLTDLPMRMLAAEITREKLFLTLHDELPYRLTVETDSWEEFKNGSVKLEQTITVERESHKRIAIGASGQTIRGVREAAQQELERMLERPVHLFLRVQVREDWSERSEHYRQWDLDPRA